MSSDSKLFTIQSLGRAAVVVVPTVAVATFGPAYHAAHPGDCELVLCSDYANHPVRHPADLPHRHYPTDRFLTAATFASGSTSATVTLSGGPFSRI